MDLDKVKTTAGLDVAGKRVLVRADLNVPVKDGRVTDATRLDRLVPGLKDLARRGAKVIVLSHFGRPKGGPDTENSLAPVAEVLGQRSAGRSHSRRDCIGEVAAEGGRRARPRRHPGAREHRASTRARKRTIRRLPRRSPSSATYSSMMLSRRRIARTPRPRASRTTCRPMPGR